MRHYTKLYWRPSTAYLYNRLLPLQTEYWITKSQAEKNVIDKYAALRQYLTHLVDFHPLANTMDDVINGTE